MNEPKPEKLGALLKRPGIHTWRFRHTTSCKTCEEAGRRVTDAVAKIRKRGTPIAVTHYSQLLADMRPPYESEPVLCLEVTL